MSPSSPIEKNNILMSPISEMTSEKTPVSQDMSPSACLLFLNSNMADDQLSHGSFKLISFCCFSTGYFLCVSLHLMLYYIDAILSCVFMFSSLVGNLEVIIFLFFFAIHGTIRDSNICPYAITLCFKGQGRIVCL